LQTAYRQFTFSNVTFLHHIFLPAKQGAGVAMIRWPWPYYVIGIALLWSAGIAYVTDPAEGFRVRDTSNWLLQHPQEIRCPRPERLSRIIGQLNQSTAGQQEIADTEQEKAREATARELAGSLRGRVAIESSRGADTGTLRPRADLVDALVEESDRKCTPEQRTLRVAEIKAQEARAERQIYTLAYLGVAPSCLLMLAALWVLRRGRRIG
jgi:hypothetical protein